MNDKIKMFIGNEEVVCSNEFTISEEMLSASSTILNNCYPKSWELTKDYVSNFYYPEDYSKLIIGNGNYQYGDTEYSVLEVSGKNLFDENYPNIAQSVKYKSIYVGEGTFTMSTTMPIIVDYTNLFFLTGNVSSGASTSGNGVWQGHSRTINSTNGYITIGYRIEGNTSPEDYKTQIEKGSYATTYEPYNQPNLKYETNVEKKWDKVEILGNNYQETRSGKNLWQNSNYYTQIPSENLTITETGFNFIRNTLTGGKYVAKNISVQNGQPYTFSANITASPSADCYLAIYRGNVYGTLLASSYSGQVTLTATANETLYFTLIINSGLQNATITNIQVEKNSTKTEYELYGLMPSQYYPSEVQNVGYQNLYEGTRNWEGVWSNSASWQDDTQKYNYLAVKKRADAWSGIYKNINVVAGKTYTFSFYAKSTATRQIGIYISGGTSGLNNQLLINTTTNWEQYSLTFTATASGTIRPRIENTSTIANNYTYICGYQLEISNSPHSFIDSGKYGIEISNIGKNLFNDNNISLGIAWNNASNTARAIIIMPVKPNTNYTISFNSISGLEGVYAFGRENANDSTRTMGNYDITGTRTLTTTANTYYLGLQFNKADITKQDITNCLFLVEEGSKTTYEPYKNNTQLYVLDEPLRAIGNVKDTFTIEDNQLKIIRYIKHIELAIADMNNNNDYPGWTNIEETAQLKVQYPNVNSSFEIAGIGCISNISNSGSAFALNTNGNGILFLPRSYWTATFTQTYWKTNYSDLILKFDYVLNYPETYTLTPAYTNNSYEGINNASFNTGLSGRNTIYYYWKNFDILFSGIVKNSGEISLNPREPHYCSLQVLDYKTFLSESNTLDFVISNKTIIEAIQMVVNAVSGYGFVVGNIGITQGNDIIGAYSTLNQSAYDVLQYLANISGSRWRARYVDSSTMAIDFYDPDLLPQANDILYTKQYYEDNNIVNLSFSYGTRDYRNKQIVLSDEIYGDIDYRENLYADGYQTTFILQENIGVVNSVSVNGVAQEVITKEEKDNGVDGDFWYTPGKDTLDSKKTLSVNSEIIVEYTPLIKGRQIIYNSDEVQRVATNTSTIGVIARYETRNDILSSQELNQVGQTYINYKGKAEVLLTLRTKDKDLFNIGEVAYFNAPITELQQNYMVKAKNIEYVVINGTPTLFYEYQLTSSYNNEKAINFFDNQRNKAQGNITMGKSITRNIDIENEATIIWQNLTISEVSIDPNNNNALNSSLNSPLVE